ncbi:MAG: hypothetical protein JSU73_03645 [candidate division WOR-3 bacterium]|nr:MAG: hypothetical protein JSU73_03645 [candidate division WOR-3 bacterium]
MTRLLPPLLLPCLLLAQTTFQRTYGGADPDYGYSLVQTADGGYVIVGQTHSFGAGATDAYLVKTNASGDTMWTRTFGGSDYDEGSSVAQTADGGYIIAGNTQSFGAGDRDVWVIKTDGNGDSLWTRTLGGAGDEYGLAVGCTVDSGHIVAGYTNSFGAGGYDIWLIRTDASGDTLWTRTYGDTLWEFGRSVQETVDRGFIIAGYTYSLRTSDCNLHLVRTDSQGDTMWTRSYGGPSGDRAYSVLQTSDGGFITAGYTVSFGAGYDDVWLIKTDASGDTSWTRTYGGSDGDGGLSLSKTTDSGYVIAGYARSFGAGGKDLWLIKTDSAGVSEWARTFGGEGGEQGHSVQQTADGGYVIAGYTSSFGAGSYDIWLIKTDSAGQVAIAETPEPEQAETMKPSLMTRAQLLAELLHDPALFLYDASGGRILNPESGVLFLRTATSTRKVIIAD